MEVNNPVLVPGVFGRNHGDALEAKASIEVRAARVIVAHNDCCLHARNDSSMGCKMISIPILSHYFHRLVADVYMLRTCIQHHRLG